MSSSYHSREQYFMLDPCFFRPSSADQRRAKKREAQRKYRRGIRLRPTALTAAREQDPEDKNEYNCDHVTSADATYEADGKDSDGRAESSGVMPQRDRATESDDDWSSMGIPESAMAPAQAIQRPQQQEQPQQQQQQQLQQAKESQQRPVQGREKRRPFYHGQASPAFAASHPAPPQATLPFSERFDDVFGSDVFAYGDGGRLMREIESHQGYLHSANLPGPMDSLGSCQRCAAFPGPLSSQSVHWKMDPEAVRPMGRCVGIDNDMGSSNQQSPAHAVMGDGRSKRPTMTGPSSGHVTVGTTSMSPAAAGRGAAQRTAASSATPSPEPMPSSPRGSVHVSASGLQGCTPLFQAVLLGNLKIATILAGKSNNPNAVNELGQTILHIAAQEGHVEIVDYLLRCGANLNACDDGGNTPLHLAVVNGQAKVVEMLVNAGADMDIVNRPRRESGMRSTNTTTALLNMY